MERNQQGGVAAFVVVALSLFLVLVASVWAAREYGPDVAETADSAISATDESIENVMSDDDEERAPNDEDEEATTENETTTTDQSTTDQTDGAISRTTPESSENDEAISDDEDYAEVVEVPDEQNASTESSRVGSAGPSAISSTGPSQIPETGPAEILATVVPLTALIAAGIAFIRSRLSLSL